MRQRAMGGSPDKPGYDGTGERQGGRRSPRHSKTPYAVKSPQMRQRAMGGSADKPGYDGGRGMEAGSVPAPPKPHTP